MGMRYAFLLLLGSMAIAAHANDFPTRARVEFVLSCMRESKAPQQESMYKCSCAVDVIADTVNYATWVELGTIASATTIAGERGGVMPMPQTMPPSSWLRASFSLSTVPMP